MAVRYAIGIDLGGTKIEAGLVDESGQVLKQIRLKTSQNGYKEIEQQIVSALTTGLLDPEYPVCGIGIGVPGQVDTEKGRVAFAPNLGWSDIALESNLHQYLRYPIKIFNDVQAITFGEWRFGAGRGSNDLVCVFVGTGIGGGIVSNGALLGGSSSGSGEVGHMVIQMDGPVCACGNRGCFEAIAGGRSIANQVKDCLKMDPTASKLLWDSCGGDLESLSTVEVVKAFRLGDSLAEKVLENALRGMITGCTNLVNILNPDALVLGGGVLDGLPEFIPVIENEVKKQALKNNTKYLRIHAAQLGKQVGVIGSAALMLGRK